MAGIACVGVQVPFLDLQSQIKVTILIFAKVKGHDLDKGFHGVPQGWESYIWKSN